MQPLPEPESNSPETGVGTGRDWRRALRAARRLWDYAPTYDAGASWTGARSGLERCVLCGALLFAMYLPVKSWGHVDLYPTYVAARLAAEGRWERLYHTSVWLHHQEDPQWDARARQWIDPEPLLGTSFVYHPWYLQLVRPIAEHCSYAEFRSFWIALCKLCMVAVAWELSVLFGWSSWLGQGSLTLLIGAASVSRDSLQVGQNGFVALTFALGAILAWRSAAPLWLGGLLAGLAWACKPWCLASLGLCFALRGVRAGISTSIALLLAMWIVPSWLFPRGLMSDYLDLNFALAKTSVPAFNNLSVLSILERAVTPGWSRLAMEWTPHAPSSALRLSAGAIALGVFGAGACIAWRRRPALRYLCCAFVAWMLVPLGVCWSHYFVFALPLACLCSFDPDSPRALRGLGCALLICLSVMMEYIPFSAHFIWSLSERAAEQPWQHACPMLLLIATSIGALSLGPADTSRRPPSAARG